MKVIIAGIGDIGLELAETLSSRSGIDLAVIDSDESKCDDLAEQIDALVLHGDGTDPAVLDKAGVKSADALIATTEADALNMVIAILGKKFSIPQVIVKINKTELRSTCEEIGVDHVISPKVSAAMEISSVLHGYDVLDFSMLIRGGARLTEISPGNMAHKNINELELPEGTLVIAILRDERAVIPRGGTVLQEDDVLLVAAESDEVLETVKQVFGGLASEFDLETS